MSYCWIFHVSEKNEKYIEDANKLHYSHKKGELTLSNKDKKKYLIDQINILKGHRNNSWLYDQVIPYEEILEITSNHQSRILITAALKKIASTTETDDENFEVLLHTANQKLDALKISYITYVMGQISVGKGRTLIPIFLMYIGENHSKTAENMYVELGLIEDNTNQENNGFTDRKEILYAGHGAHIHAVDKNGSTALMQAVSYSDDAYVFRLLTQDPDVNATDHKGGTALIYASQNGRDKIVKALILKSADIDAANHDGWTALMTACYEEHTEVVRILLNKHADVTATHKYGDTALKYASYNNNETIIQLLIGAGAKK